MDELALVARLRDGYPGIDLTAAQARLAEEISAAAAVGARPGAGPRPVLRRGVTAVPGERRARGRRAIRRRLVLSGVAAAAAAVALVVAVVAGQGQPGHRVPGALESPSRSASPTPTLAPGPAATAAELVAYATRAAASTPAYLNPHYWAYSDTLAATSSAGQGGVLFGPPNERQTQQYWQRVDGRQLAGFEHGKLVIHTARAGATFFDNMAPIGWNSIAYSYLEALPASPAQLAAMIKANLRAHPAPIGAEGQGNLGVFNSIEDVMQEVVLPPRLLATLYAVLAQDPVVHFDPSVHDLAGRTGVGFYTVQEGYDKQIIVINPKTYAYMGEEDVAVRAHTSVATDMTLHFHKGQVLGWAALLRSGFVARAGQVP